MRSIGKWPFYPSQNWRRCCAVLALRSPLSGERTGSGERKHEFIFIRNLAVASHLLRFLATSRGGHIPNKNKTWCQFLWFSMSFPPKFLLLVLVGECFLKKMKCMTALGGMLQGQGPGDLWRNTRAWNINCSVICNSVEVAEIKTEWAELKMF